MGHNRGEKSVGPRAILFTIKAIVRFEKGPNKEVDTVMCREDRPVYTALSKTS